MVHSTSRNLDRARQHLHSLIPTAAPELHHRHSSEPCRNRVGTKRRFEGCLFEGCRQMRRGDEGMEHHPSRSVSSPIALCLQEVAGWPTAARLIDDWFTPSPTTHLCDGGGMGPAGLFRTATDACERNQSATDAVTATRQMPAAGRRASTCRTRTNRGG